MPPLREYLQILLHRKWTIILVTAGVLAASLFASSRQTPLFQSQAQVLLKGGGLTSNDPTLATAPNLETEREIGSSDAVAEIAATELGVDAAGVQTGLSVDVAAATEILIFTYEHPEPEVSQERASVFAQAYIDYRRQEVLGDLLAASETVQERLTELNAQLARIRERLTRVTDPTRIASLQSHRNLLFGQVAILQQELADLSPPGKLRVGQIVDQPDLPSSPAKPDHVRNGLLGLLVGLVLGVLLALLREQLDDRIRGKTDLESLISTPVLAAIPKVAKWRKSDRPLTVTLSEPNSAAAEAYRKLRTGVLYVSLRAKAKVLMITSPQENEGKTATAANLGVALAQAENKVILVSADLRKPRLHRFFGLENSVGVTNVLGGEVSPWQVIRDTPVENLQVLVSGPLPSNPAELLGSNAMGGLLKALAEVADYVIIDAPPVMAVADPISLSPLVEGVLFVADAQNTTRAMIEQARRQLDQVDAPVIGAILNNFDPGLPGDYYYYGGGSYTYEDKAGDDEKTSLASRLPWRSASRG
jgi:polysaccharide biosynthesis transport protein